MLQELAVSNLGIIDASTLAFGAGLTAITGETGAGKTLLVEALELLLGARADPGLVRDGATQARVDGRFVDPETGDEIVLSRVIPADGRSRAYIDGRPASVSELVERGAALVELQSQHSQHALLRAAGARGAVDAFGGEALATVAEAYRAVWQRGRAIDAALTALGGDQRTRARELDLLQYQVDEIDAAGLEDPDEDVTLERESAVLADAAEHQRALAAAHALLSDRAAEAVGEAVHQLDGRPFPDVLERVRSVQIELDDVVHEVRGLTESVTVDPERLETVQQRRARLQEIRRKYGDTLAEVIAFATEARARRDELATHDERVEELTHERRAVDAELATLGADLTGRRRTAGAALGKVVSEHLADLAMAGAKLSVDITAAPPSETGADEVVFLLAANAGETARPVAKAASGGELSRIMLALRLTLTRTTDQSAGTFVFDEVDAGIGGEAGVAIGRALGAVAREHQVLCVTHLASVAAYADTQYTVVKARVGKRTVSRVDLLIDDDARARELSRMLAGVDESEHARRHAAELLAVAGDERRRGLTS